jgi:ATP-dependent exoDNAse (exonuclease V) alpha subunit
MTYWSREQEHAMHVVGRWMRNPSAPQVMYLAGFAGTGKTTLAKHLVSGAGRRWLFAAFTGKAAHVMRMKGCSGACTIHSMIYRPNGESKASEIRILESKLQKLHWQLDEATDSEQDDSEIRKTIDVIKHQVKKLHDEREPMFALWANSPLADMDVDGVVIDECSMVDDFLGQDLESFGKKILVLGDPAQLPPVGAGGRYTKREPDVMLTDVHRQAKQSGILELATLVRERGIVNAHEYGDDCEVLQTSWVDRDLLAGMVLVADQVLVGRNRTRKNFNARHRELLGRTAATPQPGDKLVCLRNDRAMGIYNGSQWRVETACSDIGSKTCDLELQCEDDSSRIRLGAWLHHMIGAEQELTSMGWDRRDLAEFDYSYALTTHKAQGSQWPHVLVFDESSAFGSEVGRRWLYTAITRATKKLTVLI